MFDVNNKLHVSCADVDAYMLQCISETPSPVMEAARYHLAAGGSRVRAQLGLDACDALGLSSTTALACAAAPELLHNASLVHDDLQDGDTMRRNKRAVWSLYGRQVAISTGDLLISAAYCAIATHPYAGAALRAMHEAVAVTISGQAQDCSAKSPSPKEYVTIAANKSGPLLVLPIRLALIAAEAPGQDVAIRAGSALAIAYQILDDIADRATDLANGATNICLSLEALGHAPTSAQIIAQDRALAALQTARRDAHALPGNVGSSLMTLADRLETQLKEVAHAT